MFGGVNEDLEGQPFNHERPYQDERFNLDDDDLYGYVHDVNDVHDDDDEFAGCIKKRVRRFYLGGFNSSITRKRYSISSISGALLLRRYVFGIV